MAPASRGDSRSSTWPRRGSRPAVAARSASAGSTTPDRVSSATGEPVLALWDGGGACGVAGSASGDAEPMMWTEGWEPPGRLFRGRWLRGWREAAADLASRGGLPERGASLGEVYQTGGVPCRDLLVRAVDALGLPAGIIGTRLGRTAHLSDVDRTPGL